MNENLDIRKSSSGDVADILAIYPQAFPDEELQPLVRDLLEDTAQPLSLVARVDESIVGHIVFSRCTIEGSSVEAALLGPLAVTPEQQRRGIGTRLIETGLQQLSANHVEHVFVLGDPAYYERSGFAPDHNVSMPYTSPDPLPKEWEGAWQSLRLANVTSNPVGKLSVPAPWRKPVLWLP